jgi:predicted flavoprotein YhiN
MSEFIKNIPGNGKFLYSSFNNYTNLDIIEFLNKQGVETKVERGKRVFPHSDKSQDVLDAFVKKLRELNVEIKLNTSAVKILTKVKNEKLNIASVNLENGETIEADKVILATRWSKLSSNRFNRRWI